MKILRLKIENFLVLTEADINLADRGLVLIQGENNADTSADSNGAGKSSIADALCWSIYGTTARGESGDAVVNNKAGKNTRVEVHIDDDAVQYRIVRHRKHKTGKNNLHVFMNDGSGEKDLTKGTDKLTQEVVDKIIGASLDVFTGSIYAGQEKMPDLPSMTDKMLKVLIEEAAGINALETAYKKARENMQIAKTDVAAIEMEIASVEMDLTGLQRQYDSTLQMEKDWELNRQSQIKALTERTRELIAEAKALAAQAPQTEIDRLTAEIQAIDAKVAAVGQEQLQLQQLTRTVLQAQNEARTLANTLTSSQRLVLALKKKVADVDHKVGCPCDACGRPLSQGELAAARAAAQAELDKAEADVTSEMTALDVAESAAKAAEAACDAFRLGMTDVGAEVAQRAVLEAQRGNLMRTDQQRVQTAAQARNDLATIQRLQAETSPFVATAQDVKARIDKRSAEVTKKRGELAIRQQRLDLETEVVRVFAPAGVRARVLDEVTPYLNAQTGKYLAVLSDGNITAEWSTLTVSKAGEMKERFAIDVESAISAKSFKGLSGGEKRKVRVATALALQDLVATRATKPIDLFVGDEIDHALDASGLERLMIILEDKARERGTVMVISHNSLRDEIRQVMLVERSASGETKITETAA